MFFFFIKKPGFFPILPSIYFLIDTVFYTYFIELKFSLFSPAVERLIIALANFSKTLVAAVNGDTTGLGLAILPLCDIVYASDRAMFRSHAARYSTTLLKQGEVS